MTDTPESTEPAKVTCPTCGGHPKEPSVRIEGGSVSCRFCNRTFTFNMMRDRGAAYRKCSCQRARDHRCETCGGDGIVDAPPPAVPVDGDSGRPGVRSGTVCCPVCTRPYKLDRDTDRWYCQTTDCPKWAEQVTDAEIVLIARAQRDVTTPTPPETDAPRPPVGAGELDRLAGQIAGLRVAVDQDRQAITLALSQVSSRLGDLFEAISALKKELS